MNLAVQSIMLGLDSATKISVGYLLARLGIQVDSRLTIEEEDTEQLKNLESKLQGLEEVIRGMTTQAEQNVKKVKKIFKYLGESHKEINRLRQTHGEPILHFGASHKQMIHNDSNSNLNSRNVTKKAPSAARS